MTRLKMSGLAWSSPLHLECDWSASVPMCVVFVLLQETRYRAIGFSAGKFADGGVLIRVGSNQATRRDTASSRINSVWRSWQFLADIPPRFCGTRSAQSEEWRRRLTRRKHGSGWRRCSGMWRRRRAQRGEETRRDVKFEIISRTIALCDIYVLPATART